MSHAFGSAAGPDGPAAAPTAAFHSALLHYSCGVLRTEFGPTARWPYHRAAPSARCFAPVEAYLWTPGHEGLPAGVHAYDPAHHALVRLRPGDHRSVLGKAMGADIEDALGVLILSTVFWRTAFRYGDYAYRLCAQETGLVAGNVMMVAGTLGAEAHLHHQFLDGTLDRLLGTEGPQESIAAVLPLYPRRAEGPRPVRRSAATHAEPALSALLGPPPGRPRDRADRSPRAGRTDRGRRRCPAHQHGCLLPAACGDTSPGSRRGRRWGAPSSPTACGGGPPAAPRSNRLAVPCRWPPCSVRSAPCSPPGCPMPCRTATRRPSRCTCGRST